jgi:very-short-patch-repair endonuclease
MCSERGLDLFDLGERQHGVFSLNQARASRAAELQLERLLRSGAVEPWLPGVYRVRGTPPTWHLRLMAATLSIPGSLVSHRSASLLWEVGDFAAGRPELVVERWTRRHRLASAIIVHESKDLVGGDVDRRFGIPCTSLVRTLVDLPAVATSFKCGDALDTAFRRDPTVIQRVTTRHLEVARRGRRGTTKLRALLQERGYVGDKVDSGFERRALRLVRSGGLPEPVLQHQVRDREFVAYLDLAWPDAMVAMECDSVAHHLSVQAFEHDRSRRRRLIALGWTILEFTYAEVTRNPAMVLAELNRYLRPRP